MKPVSNSDFIEGDGIAAIFSDDNLLVYKTVRNKCIKILNVFDGSLQQFEIPHEKQQEQILGVAIKKSENSKTLLIAASTCVLATN